MPGRLVQLQGVGQGALKGGEGSLLKVWGATVESMKSMVGHWVAEAGMVRVTP